MKYFARLCVEKFLQLLVRIKLARSRATIIGVTGSFGKTSTKEAVYMVLKSKWRVYRSQKSLNTEIGLLLAVLEQESGFSSPLKWLRVLAKAVINAFVSRRYDFLVLEYGADKPGDIEQLISVVPPDIGIITHIAAVHQGQGQFPSEEAVFKEKQKLVTRLPHEGIAILNGADKHLRTLTHLAAKTFFWNGGGEAFLTADSLRETRDGFEATIHQSEVKVPAYFHVAGSYHIDIIMPALVVGILHGVPLQEGVAALREFRMPPGRMSIIEGKNGATLLDSTYNASPETMKQALALLHTFPGKRKIAVIGSMNELGEGGPAAHRELASHLGQWLDLLITVGELAKETALAALKHAVAEHRMRTFSTAEEAAQFLLERGMHRDDVILFKGSQNQVRLERAVKLLMAAPQQARRLLCRQEKEWEEI